MKPGIMLVTRNFPPILGGMERLLRHAYLELEKEFDSASSVRKVVSGMQVPQPEFRFARYPRDLSCMHVMARLPDGSESATRVDHRR
jgi:hypothetical protein